MAKKPNPTAPATEAVSPPAPTAPQSPPVVPPPAPTPPAAASTEPPAPTPPVVPPPATTTAELPTEPVVERDDEADGDEQFGRVEALARLDAIDRRIAEADNLADVKAAVAEMSALLRAAMTA